MLRVMSHDIGTLSLLVFSMQMGCSMKWSNSKMWLGGKRQDSVLGKEREGAGCRKMEMRDWGKAVPRNWRLHCCVIGRDESGWESMAGKLFRVWRGQYHIWGGTSGSETWSQWEYFSEKRIDLRLGEKGLFPNNTTSSSTCKEFYLLVFRVSTKLEQLELC